MSRKFSSYLLLALLVLSTIAVAVPLLSTPAAAAGKSAWLKIVTSAWKGASCGIYDGISTGFADDAPGVNTPMCPGGSGFADRFNVTGQEAFVEVYGIDPSFGSLQFEGTFEPNATGFVKISWTVNDDWGLLILVKAKSYYGTKIGEGEPFSGIIMYALLIPPRNATGPALSDSIVEKIANITGVRTIDRDADGTLDYPSLLKANFSLNLDGTYSWHTNEFIDDDTEPDEDLNDYFNFVNSGPFDYLNGSNVDLGSFATVFGNETEWTDEAGNVHHDPVNAWVARVAKIFKLFHVHSWYDTKDNLSFAQIKIYDLDHTSPTSEDSLIQAAVTGEDGQSRYTKEVYPPEEIEKDGTFKNNPYVPIPLQIFNLNNKTVFHGGFPEVATGRYAVGAPHLNATVRVWWETVIVNQTIYYGKYINGTLDSYPDYTDDGLNLTTPAFRGPLNFYHNASVVTVGADEGEPARVANFLNSTVFYAFFCTFDNDTKIHFPRYTGGYGGYREVYALYASMDLDGDGRIDLPDEDVTGDQLINARVTINLKDNKNDTYHQTKNVLTTNATGCTDDPHKYRGGLYDRFARFPNATMWNINGTLYTDNNDNGIPDYFDNLGIGSFWKKFGKYVRLNVSLMYRPGDADNKDDIPDSTGSHLKDVESPPRIGDEDVLESDYYKGNWSMLVADVDYANTLTIKDDKPYDGMDVLVYWTGGWRNVYPGPSDGYLVGEVRVRNPYGIAFRKATWIPQPDNEYDPTDNKKPSAAMSRWITWDTPILRVVKKVPGVADYERGLINMTTYVYDISLRVTDAMGNVLPPDKTEVQLILPDGQYYSREPSIDESLLTGMGWSYAHFDQNVTFFQLPGNIGPYGVRIFINGKPVYENFDVIDVLTKTEFILIRTPVYTIKLVFYDCENETIPQLYVHVTTPEGTSSWRQTSEHGELEFAFIPEGTLTIHKVWWKGVNVTLLKAEDAGGNDLPLTEDNELKVEISNETNAPIKIWVPLKTLVFYTTDFQGEMKIPYLNITLTWIGTYKPFTNEKVYFLETLDPTGDEDTSAYNTSIIVHPLWFRYEAKAFFHKVAEDEPRENLVKYEAKYVFYKMPPAIYNITVTTVTEDKYKNVDGVDMRTPAYSKWPGRIDMEVPYEIKIDWTWAEEYEDSVPSMRTGPAGVVNDRVVLRIFGSMNGVPVTTENFPADLVEAWNPDDIGNRTALVCEEEITLKTWAHDFWMRVINGEYRVGDAEFKIINDNGRTMRYYDIEEEKWIGETYTSKWDGDIFGISALRKDGLPTSNIYWNGSYLLTGLRFETNLTYSYSKGENASFIVDKFYNASMTSDATPGADGYWSPNEVDPTLNFTLVGTEKLWKTSRRFDDWVARIEGNTWKDWYSAWFLVYELPSPDDEYKVEAGVDGKGVLPIPIPVAFIKLKAFAKDGATPLANALIELWALHMSVDTEAPDIDAVKISDADSGTGTLDFGPKGYVDVEWEWEKKLKESDEPQIFEETRWDRIKITFTAPEYCYETEYQISASAGGVVLNFTGVRETRLSVSYPWGTAEVVIHLVGTTPPNNATFTVELYADHELIGSNTTSIENEGTIMVGGISVTFSNLASDDKGVVFDVIVSGYVPYRYCVGGESKTIFVQVPPAPAKLMLRNVVGEYDVAISEDYIYPLLDKPDPVDRNTEAMIPDDRSPSTFRPTSLQTDEWGTPDGLLAYGRWYTDEDGYVDSFKDLGPDDPRYGTVVLPIAGWLNETFHDDDYDSKDEFHYQINVVWKSAVVYSDNIVLDKTGYEIKPTEVYNVRFIFALSNSTSTADAVKNLNLWIYYPNVTEWHEANLWTAYPIDREAPLDDDALPIPQDYEACEDSVFACDLRVTLISEMDADGVVEFGLIPGPRFMNTTWKYVFSANHSAIDWLDDLVATQFVLNNETFGDNGLRAAGSLSIDVPIMLNAAKEIMFVALTWRDEAGIATAYPIQGYTVKYAVRNLDSGIVAAEGEAKTDKDGVVRVASGRDPEKVFWAGMTIRYRVEPPDPTMTHAYYPDEEPTHWALAPLETTIDPETGECSGICILDARCKPYLITIDYTAITIRVTDVNGRPVVGAKVELVDKASLKTASWSTTVDTTWKAKPIEDICLLDEHVIKYQAERVLGGAGSTKLMNVSIGPVAYDADNDDKIDYNNTERGISAPVTYIVRVYWTPAGKEEVRDNVRILIPNPEIRGKSAKVYDSTEDEITWKTIQPRYMARGNIYLPTVTETGSLVKEHVDVTAKIMDVRLKFGYEGKELPKDVAADVSAKLTGQEGKLVISAAGKELKAIGLVPGTYRLEVYVKGYDKPVATEPIELTNDNVDRTVQLALTDVIVEVYDRLGRPVTGFSITVEGPYYKEVTPPKDNKATIVALVKHESYMITAAVERYGVKTATSYEGLPEPKIKLVLPIGDVKITVVDLDGRPVGAATVTLAGVEQTTDAQGTVIFQGIPLLDETGSPVSYDVKVTREKTITTTITVSTENTEFKITYGLGSINVIVKGAAGQPLAGAKVDLIRGGTVVATGVTDDKGVVTFTGLPADTYTVKVVWKDYADEKTVTLTEDDIMARKPLTVEFTLPPFTEIAGIPLDFGTFLALIIGIILLIIVLAIIISEYVRWRGRRLGIYPPPPPKK